MEDSRQDLRTEFRAATESAVKVEVEVKVEAEVEDGRRSEAHGLRLWRTRAGLSEAMNSLRLAREGRSAAMNCGRRPRR
jgi:hypothetical protein